MRVITNRGLDGKFQKLTDTLEEYPRAYLNLVASELVLNSPVDSGTYMDNHYVEGSGTDGTPTSKGKPTKQPWQTFANKAINRMSTAIATFTGNIATFGNSSYHSNLVEYKHGYAPFEKTRREHRRLAKQALESLK